jgi:hypothetical protein
MDQFPFFKPHIMSASPDLASNGHQLCRGLAAEALPGIDLWEPAIVGKNQKKADDKFIESYSYSIINHFLAGYYSQTQKI